MINFHQHEPRGGLRISSLYNVFLLKQHDGKTKANKLHQYFVGRSPPEYKRVDTPSLSKVEQLFHELANLAQIK